MDTLDIFLLGILCCLIGVGFLFRQRRAVRFVVIFVLFCVSFGSVVSLSTVPRSALNQHEREGGRFSQEFSDGVSTASKISELFYPYILLSTVGLALMAFLSQKKGRDDT